RSRGMGPCVRRDDGGCVFACDGSIPLAVIARSNATKQSRRPPPARLPPRRDFRLLRGARHRACAFRHPLARHYRGERFAGANETSHRAALAYLRTRELNGALLAVGAPGRGAAGPVFLQVGTASVEPTEGHTYDPTDGATTDPSPAVPAWLPFTTDDPEGPCTCAKTAV